MLRSDYEKVKEKHVWNLFTKSGVELGGGMLFFQNTHEFNGWIRFLSDNRVHQGE